MTSIHRSIIAAALCALMSCEEQGVITVVPIPPIDRYQWKTTSFDEAHVDSVKIDSAKTLFAMNENYFSFIVIRNGALVTEFYNAPFHWYNEFEQRSATKSVVSALVGIALQQGLIDSLDQTMISFFPEYDTPDLDPRTRTITIRHLLTMRAGFDYTDANPGPYLDSPTADRVNLIIHLPLKYNPGEKFYYGSIQTHLLSAIITKRSGMTTKAYAQKYLFGPAKMYLGSWSTDPQGIYFGGSGLVMSSRDMARFGYLYLQHGTLDSVQIVPRHWIEQSIQPNNPVNSVWSDFTERNYGFSWWTNYPSGDSIYFAAGSGGQFIVVLPSKHAVIVVTANPNLPTETVERQEDDLIRIISRYLIPSLQ
jgi:CubicO group peptidase (beta-lactamase class C family)